MKPIAFTLVAALLAAGTALGGPLQKSHVASDAKWLVHLDLDKMLRTDVGQWIAEELLDKQLAKPIQDLKQQFGIDLDWRQIQGVTAYGTQFKAKGDPGGVLLFEGGLDFGHALDAVIQRLQTLLPGGDLPLQKVQEDNAASYSLKDEVFGVALPGPLFLLSKSKDELQKAREVVAGTAPNLGSARASARMPEAGRGGFLFGLVGSLERAPVPAQVKGLKQIESAQVVLGEKDANVFARLALNAKDTNAATQVQQILQGLVALATLNQPADKNAQKLAQAARVSSAEKVVTVKMELPAADVIEMAKQGQQKRGATPDQPAKPRRREKANGG